MKKNALALALALTITLQAKTVYTCVEIGSGDLIDNKVVQGWPIKDSKYQVQLTFDFPLLKVVRYYTPTQEITEVERYITPPEEDPTEEPTIKYGVIRYTPEARKSIKLDTVSGFMSTNFFIDKKTLNGKITKNHRIEYQCEEQK